MKSFYPNFLPCQTGFAYDADSVMLGAIYVAGQNLRLCTDTWNVSRHVWAFNASRCSPVYGNSQTVQPSALSLIAQFRY